MRRALTGLCLLLSVVLPLGAWALNAGLGEPPASVDRQTPYATANGFVNAAQQGNYALAAHYLDLDFLPPAEQRREGARLAWRLRLILDRKLPPGALTTLSTDPEGDSGGRTERIATLTAGKNHYPLQLARAQVNAGGSDGGTEGRWVWVFSQATVKAIDPLYDASNLESQVLGVQLPPMLFERSVLGLEPWRWLGLVVTMLGAWLLGLVLERLSLAVAGRLASWTRVTWDDALVPAGEGPLKLLYFALLWAAGTALLQLPPPAQFLVTHCVTTLVIVAVAWFVLRFLRLTAQVVQQAAPQDAKDAARARGLHTQLAVLRSVFEVATYIVSAALLLMQFETVRNIGVSLLASAGIAGLVIGLAAQKSISSLLAGIQLSFTQPIRIGDQVVVENEFGTVEEITLTYVVVRVWDERRMVIPISEFLEKPFQNWSKGGQTMLGPVKLLVDFTTDMEALRAELRRILENEGKALWDGKVASVVVEEMLDRTLQVRVLLSATPGDLFDLRCLVREKMLAYLRARPEWLPTTRTEPRPTVPKPAGEQVEPPPPITPRA